MPSTEHTSLPPGLLTPSLSSSGPPVTLYSTRSSFLVAMFGGPFAIILYSALNSWRLRRRIDIAAYVAALAAMMLVTVAVMSGHPAYVWLSEHWGSDVMGVLRRLPPLLLCGAFYLMHRKQHQAASLFGLKPPSPWLPAIACGVAGIAIGYGLLYLVVAP